MPFGLLVALLCSAAKPCAPALHRSVSDIGRLVHSIEYAVGLADCYPRALLTSYLCVQSGRSCELVVGTLAPTRKMHAWCSTDGQLPYEAMPEHYLYRPVLILTLTP